jgi:hypothetical protein
MFKERKKGWGCELDSSGSEWGPVKDPDEHSHEPLGSIEFGEFNQLMVCQLLMDESASWYTGIS